MSLLFLTIIIDTKLEYSIFVYDYNIDQLEKKLAFSLFIIKAIIYMHISSKRPKVFPTLQQRSMLKLFDSKSEVKRRGFLWVAVTT